MRRTITIKTKEHEYTIAEGKPAIVVRKSKNKSRQGTSTGVGWIIRGEKPHTIRLIHSCFQTWDKVEQEYPASWTIWDSQIIAVNALATVAGR